VGHLYGAAVGLAAASSIAAVGDALLPPAIAALGAAGGLLAVAGHGDGEQAATVQAGVLAPELVAAFRGEVPGQASPLADALAAPDPLWLGSPEELAGRYPALARGEPAAWAIAPLHAGGAPLGALALAFADPQAFAPKDRLFLLTMAAQAAAALSRLRQAEAMQRHGARLQALAEASQAFSQAGHDLDDVLEQVIRRVSELIGGACAVRLIDADGEHLRLAAMFHPDPELAAGARALLEATPQRVDEGISALILNHGRPVLLPVVDGAALRATVRPIFHGHLDRWPIHSMLIVPLRARGEIFGLLSMTRYAGEPSYTLDDQTFLMGLADRAALAIANASLFREAAQARAAAEHAAAHTLRLQHLTAALAEALTPDEVMAIVAAQVAQIVGPASGVIGLVSADGQVLELVQMAGYTSGDLRPWQRTPLDSRQPGPDVVRSGRAQFWETREALLATYPELATALRSAAWAIVPLRAEGQILGILSLGFTAPRRFDPDERALIEMLARQCATAMQRTERFLAVEQARAAAEQAANRIARLQGVTAALGAAATPDEVGAIIVEEGMAAVGADAGAIFMFDPGAHAFRILTYRNEPGELEPQYLWRRADRPGPLRDVLETRSIVLVETPEELDRRWPQLTGNQQRSGDAATAAVPLLLDEQILGAFYLAFRAPHRFTPEEQALLLALGQQCAQALERARLYVAERAARLGAERTAAHTARLYAITAALAETLTLDEVAAVIVEQGMAALDASAGSVRQLSPDGAALHAIQVVGYPPDLNARWQVIPLDAPVPMAEVARAGRPMLIETPAEVDAQWPHLSDAMRALGYQAAALLPLVVAGRLIGTMSFGFAVPRAFSADDRGFLDAMAHQCAIALERARLYHQAREAIQIRDQFLSIAAHELKTPLTSLSGQAQLIQRRLDRGELTPERLARSVSVIAGQAERLDAMVRTLLDVGRLERGQFALELQPVDLGALLDRVVDELRPDLDRHTIRYERGPAPLVVEGDLMRLEQVIQNLLSNAVKYSPSGGTITVRLGREGRAAVVSVSDQGVGIPAAALPQLFQRFFRAANVSAHHISGMGIGLYVVREIVTQHGGEVFVASVEGEGSTFTVALPLAAPAT